MSELGSGLSRRALLSRGGGVGAAVGLAVALDACGSSGSSGATTAKPKPGGTLRVGISDASRAKLADPQNALTSLDIIMAYTLYDYCYHQDPDGSYSPALVTEATPSDGGKVWTLRLRSDVEFQNGQSLTADDLMFTVRRALNPKKPAIFAAPQWDWADPNAMKKKDNLTVEFTLQKPCAIVPSRLIQAAILPTGFDANNPVGTGAFKLLSAPPGQGAQTERFANYWRGPAYLEKLNFIPFADPSSELNALQGGEIDAMDNLSTDQIATVKGSSAFAILRSGTNGGNCRQFSMQTHTAPYNNNDVRQALRLLANREQMIQQVFPGEAVLANDVWQAKGSPDYNDSLPQRQYDPEKAKSLLKRAGHENTTFMLSTADAGSGMTAAAQAFAAEANSAGVKVQVQNQDPNTYFASAYGAYPFYVSFSAGSYPYLELVQTFMVPGAVFNETKWSDPQYEKLYAEASAELDATKRKALTDQMQQIEYDSGGELIWAWVNQLSVLSTKFAGLPATDRTGNSFTGYDFRKVYQA